MIMDRDNIDLIKIPDLNEIKDALFKKHKDRMALVWVFLSKIGILLVSNLQTVL